MIDTGSTHIVVPKETAERLHCRPAELSTFRRTRQTAVIQNAQITIHKLIIGPYSGEQTFPLW